MPTFAILLVGVVVFFIEIDRREANIEVGTEDNEDALGGVASDPDPACRDPSSDVDFL